MVFNGKLSVKGDLKLIQLFKEDARRQGVNPSELARRKLFEEALPLEATLTTMMETMIEMKRTLDEHTTLLHALRKQR